MLITYYIDEDAPEGSEVSIGDFSAVVHYDNDGTSKSDYNDINDTINTNKSLDSYLVDSTAEFKYNITINFYFVGEDGDGNYKIPDYADGFLGGYYTNGTYNSGGTWTTPDEESTKLTENTSGVTTYYSITLSELYAGDVTFQIYLEYTDEDTDGSFDDWSHQMEDINYTVSKYLANGSTIDVTVNQDPNDFISEERGDEPGGESITVTTYICVVDSTGKGWVNGATFHNSDNIFVNNGDENWHNYDSSTWIQAYVGSSGRNAYYQTSTLELESGSTYWITFQGSHSDQEYYFEMTIPSNCGEEATFVIYADMTKFDEYETTSYTSFSTEISGGTWYSGAVSDVVGEGGQLK